MGGRWPQKLIRKQSNVSKRKASHSGKSPDEWCSLAVPSTIISSAPRP
jgi:hypothetical protein